MRYSDDYLREFLPREDPPAWSIPEAVNEEIEGWLEDEGLEDHDLVARSTKWTYALISELHLHQFRIQEPVGQAFQLFSTHTLPALLIGLFDYESEPAGFGFITLLPESDEEHFKPGIVARLSFPRLDASFPLIFRAVSYEDHSPTHPSSATAACWAECRQTSRWGILTAGHIAPFSRPGRQIPLAGGGYGVLARSFHPVVDAAFVHTTAPPRALSRLPVRRYAAAGHTVIGELKSGQESRTVVHVDAFMQVVNTFAYPVQLFLDRPFQPGDSGALIKSRPGEALGIYLGSLKSPAVPTGLAGRALNFEQAVLALKITPYL